MLMDVKDTKLLEDIGLTHGETKVYLALLRLGATKTGLLAKEAGVSSSKVYKILDRLIKKGLVGHVLKGKIKHFKALEPKRIIEYMEEKEKQLSEKKEFVKKLLPQFEMEQKLAGKKTGAIIYEGFKATTNFFRNILDDLKAGEEYYVIGASYGEVSALRPFFYNYHFQRVKKGIIVKMLANYDTKGNLEKTTAKKSEIRYLPKQFISNMQITFYKNKAFISLWTKTPIGFLIEDEEAVKGFRKYFNAFWKIAKK